MLERFLRYSLERSQKISMIAEIDGIMKKMTVTIVRMDEKEISYVTSRSTKEKTLVADWQAHSIVYTDIELNKKDLLQSREGAMYQTPLTTEERLMLEQVGRTFASKWLGEALHLTQWRQSGQRLTLEFHPVEGESILFYNSVEMEVTKDGVIRAIITMWRTDTDGETLTTMPLDEILFEQLKFMNEDLKTSSERTEDTVTAIIPGYEIISQDGETAVAVPNITIVLESGLQYTVRLSGENQQKK